MFCSEALGPFLQPLHPVWLAHPIQHAIAANPAPHSVELYQAYADYDDMMVLTEAIIRDCAIAACGSTTVQYQGITLDFAQVWGYELGLQVDTGPIPSHVCEGAMRAL